MRRKRPGAILLRLLLLVCCLPAGKSVADEICGHRTAAAVEITRGRTVVGSFSVALADTPPSRREGLMRCPSLAPNTGMLFVYPNAGVKSFWMKNTIIELAIIFISADNRIASIARGEPGSVDHIRSSGNVRLVLEVNYPESRHLEIGDRVRVDLKTDTDGRQNSRYRP